MQIHDPFLILGVADDADDATIETAYREGIRRCPPDRDPDGFQRLRQAYEQVRTRRDRIAYRLFDRQPPTPAEMLERGAPIRPARRPPAATLAALLRGEP